MKTIHERYLMLQRMKLSKKCLEKGHKWIDFDPDSCGNHLRICSRCSKYENRLQERV